MKTARFLFVVAALLSIEAINLTNGFPSFSTLQSNYPSYSTYDSDTGMVDHAGLRKWLYYKNTCAMRVSYAMIHSGHSISISSGECNWSGVRAARASGSYYNKKYIIRVGTMRCYLEKTIGAATTGTQSDFSGHKGIIVFQGCNFQVATGHVDLWDGSSCSGTCYFNSCNNVRLFKL
ncbi:uncharacterized protein LOC110235338 [Exaiptasia diaphana]|uniref:Uncharacterized protein n=1 Tax=Exaiptasia diaphana TaxID=2652724 RepID=A0A913WZD3_EXADI|nr:uncharacterized protein LOC110235338 [Exaiptasia diaphana]